MNYSFIRYYNNNCCFFEKVWLLVVDCLLDNALVADQCSFLANRSDLEKLTQAQYLLVWHEQFGGKSDYMMLVDDHFFQDFVSKGEPAEEKTDVGGAGNDWNFDDSEDQQWNILGSGRKYENFVDDNCLSEDSGAEAEFDDW
ncbi:hypothetical protein DITRI_Ditri12bG0082300 [Diplodiscus trichospermus]